jgi:hypothetical protein
MPWAAIGPAIGAIGSIAGGIIGGNAQEEAAKQEIAAEQQALHFQEGVYGTAQGNLNPYIKSGTNALYSLDSLYGLPGQAGQPNTGNGAQQAFANFTQTPAYTFGLGQGELAANRSLAAQGLNGSGAAAKALTQYGQGYASQNFGNYVNQLQSLAGMGQSSASSLGSIGVGVGSQVGSTEGQIGAAGAAGTIGSTNSLLNGIGGAIGALSSPNFLNSLGGSSYQVGSTSQVGSATLNGGQPYTSAQYATLSPQQPSISG